MEAELLTVLGHIPAPDDRDVPTQLENIIERSRVIRTMFSDMCQVVGFVCVYVGPRTGSCRVARSSFRREGLGSPDSRLNWRRQSKTTVYDSQEHTGFKVFLCCLCVACRNQLKAKKRRVEGMDTLYCNFTSNNLEKKKQPKPGIELA